MNNVDENYLCKIYKKEALHLDRSGFHSQMIKLQANSMHFINQK